MNKHMIKPNDYKELHNLVWNELCVQYNSGKPNWNKVQQLRIVMDYLKTKLVETKLSKAA